VCPGPGRAASVQPFHTHPHRQSCSVRLRSPPALSYVDAGSDLRSSGSSDQPSRLDRCVPGRPAGCTHAPRPRAQKWGPAIRGSVRNLNALEVTDTDRARGSRSESLRLYCSTHPNMRISLRMLVMPRVIIELSLLTMVRTPRQLDESAAIYILSNPNFMSLLKKSISSW